MNEHDKIKVRLTLQLSPKVLEWVKKMAESAKASVEEVVVQLLEEAAK